MTTPAIRYATAHLSRQQPVTDQLATAYEGNQVTLLMHRAQARTQPSPAALADTAFPTTITEAINTPTPPGASSPSAPSTAPARGRTA